MPKFMNTSNGRTRGASTNVDLVLRKVRELTEEAGGTQALIDEFGGAGVVFEPDDDEYEYVVFDDPRRATGLANRLNEGKVKYAEDIANGEGIFLATTMSLGEPGGYFVPDYTSDRWEEVKDEYKRQTFVDEEERRDWFVANDVPFRELNRSMLVITWDDRVTASEAAEETEEVDA